MNRATLAIASFLIGLIIVASLLTVGTLTGMLWPWILALWTSSFLLIIIVGCIFRIYRRLVTRLRRTEEQLSEMKLLQERRYEQLAARLDALSFDSLNKQQSAAGAASGAQLSTLEHLIARSEKAERRILGRLENLTFLQDKYLKGR